MNSIYNEGKLAIAEKFIESWRIKHKYMIAILKNVWIDILNDIVKK